MSSSSDQEIRRHEAFRAAGLRPVRLQALDTCEPAFIEECRRQSRSLRGDLQEEDVLEWLEQLADRDGWY